ncbi:MAG: ABC transporter substrate-binding protein [Burkholderiales bacterium]|nr:ABC transporter substrate-binding protein [Burkholderiales bacterium]
MRRLAAALWLICATAASATITVQDDAGHAVTLAQSAKRIVSLSPHATELLYALGAGPHIVGRDGASDYPAEVVKLPAVGQYGAFNVEAIMALRPDLVVAWEGPQAGAATSRLRALGVPVFASEPDSVARIPATLRALGRLAGLDAAGETQASQFEAGWQALAARYAHAAPLNVVPQVGTAPAITVNDKQFVAAVFHACGARNPYGSETAAVPLLSPESLLASHPQAIVALADTDKEADAWFAQWRTLGLHAAYLRVPATTLGRPGPRVLPAAQALCAQLDRLRPGAKID